MEKNIFTPWEWYCEYNQDQIKSMRDNIFNNLNKEKKINDRKNDNQDKPDEEEWDYILWLA